MKAAIINKWGSPEVFEIIDNAAIPKPAENQCLIQVFFSSVNPVDFKHRVGYHKYILGSPFPISLGYDVCGKVIETGSRVCKFKKGDIVFGDLDKKYGGALAGYAVGSENCFALKPDNITSQEAAGFPLASLTALQALRDKAGLKEGQTVIINGASGGVGHFALQIAKILGAKTIAVSSSKSKDFVMQFAPDKFIDYTKEDITKTEIKADVFFDVAGKLSFPKCLQVLNKKGIYISTLPRPKIVLHKLLQVFTKGKKVKTLLRKHSYSDMQLLAKWIKEGKLKVEIDKVFSLKNIADAHRYAELEHTKGKNIIEITP
ncbi:MAG: NAD(P)-dependent alcohol dehydrogenase [Bacteroidales bacterium]|nr:NAD(P)-dependent alcohol dehydrogenase [Bacteroidales bacterium]MBN2819746.1 NAD(P)-dependent alcohol dehydrogenase [Bacteroidales bacterium]